MRAMGYEPGVGGLCGESCLLNPRVRVAVIGVGQHGRNHALQYRAMEQAELAGVYDIRAERAAQVAQELGVRAFASLEEALSIVEAASLVVPTRFHAAIARQAFAAGVDVLLEKPITTTVEEADGLIARAEAEGRVFQVGHVERFNPGVAAAKAITTHPLFFEVHRLGVFSPRSLDVDVVYDLMIHDLDLILWLSGSRVESVHAVGLPVLSDKVDIANVRLELASGAVANLTASRVSTERVRKFRYFQPHEYVSIDFARRDAFVIGVTRRNDQPQIDFRKLECAPGETLRGELEDFVECVRSRRMPRVTGYDGRQALALAAEVMKGIELHAARVHQQLKPVAGHSGEC